jgi:hypothetical protein
LTTLPVVEGNAVEVELNLQFVGIVGVERGFLPRRVGILGIGAGKDDVLFVRTPNSIGLHIARIVSAGKWFSEAGGTVVDSENAARRIKNLKEVVVLKIRNVKRAGNALVLPGKSGEHVLPVG